MHKGAVFGIISDFSSETGKHEGMESHVKHREKDKPATFNSMFSENILLEKSVKENIFFFI